MNSAHRYRWRCAGSLALILVLVMNVNGYGDQSPPPADDPIREIRFGLAAHDVDRLWSQESKEQGPSISAAIIFNRALFDLFNATAYPSLGASLNTRGDTSKLTGGFLLQWEPVHPFSVATGFGLALHNGQLDTDSSDRKSLGSRVLFWIPIEIGYAFNRHHRIILAFDHVSNAYLVTPNEGMDTLGLLYGYRF